MSRSRTLPIALGTLACLAVAVNAGAAGRYHPRLRFQELRTAHFTIYFHQGESELAARLAVIAEGVRSDLSRRTTLDAPPHVHVVLVDQSDVSNGWSTPLPYDLIEIAAVPPPPSSFLGHDDDWLRTVFTHEYAHVLHLDRVGGWMRAARWLVGRHPATFPNLYVPEWQIEGFPTWAEGAASGLGRMRAADVASVTTLAAAGSRASIDRSGGGLVAWPSGYASYFLGGSLSDQLARRHSEATLGRLTRETARRLPFLGGKAFQRVFGATADSMWKERFASRPAPSDSRSASMTQLTREGFVVSGPRFIRPSSSPTAVPADTICFSTQSQHHFPEIRRVTLEGTGAVAVVSRYGGDTLASDGRWIYFDQLEYDGAVALVSDLYAFDLESGRTARLSHGARLVDPDIARAGTRLVAVQVRDGQKRLAVWSVRASEHEPPRLSPEPERTLGTPGCGYAAPRWSPDATRIVASRQCPGALPAIAVFDANGAELLVTSEPGTRNITPTWSPDGRTILFASDRSDHRFKIYGVSDAVPPARGTTAAPVLLVDAPGGATWPDVASDGRTVVFTSLTRDGYDVFSAALPAWSDDVSRPVVSAEDVPPARDTLPAGLPPGHLEPAGGAFAPRPYSAWRTLLPRAWYPYLSMSGERTDIGASLGASDALGYHEYQVAASWRASDRATDYAFAGPAVEWSAWYSFSRWRPSLFLSASDTVGAVTLGVAGSDAARTADERAREVFAGVVIPWRRVRVSQSWLAGIGVEERRLPAATGVPARWRNALPRRMES